MIAINWLFQYLRVPQLELKIHYHYYTMQLAHLADKKMQFAMVCTMTNNIRIILTPLLITSFVCGLRIIEFSTDYLNPWFSFIYMLLLWSIYYFLFSYTIISYITYNIIYHICLYLDFFVMLMSIAFGMYYDKVRKS